MEKAQDLIVIKSLVHDSLIARGGKQLTPDIINEIASELIGRLAEIWDEKSLEGALYVDRY